jgi:hypothetical protein
VKKTIPVSALILLLLVSCQSNNSLTLDTSKLNKVEMGDMTEEQKKILPITYEAPSVEVGLDALPFEMNLPKKYPFDAKPFQPPVINDMTHEGKKLMVEFRTFSVKKEENIILMVKASYPVDDSQVPNAEDVELKNGVVGQYLGNTVSFQLEDVVYDVVYVNKNIPIDQHKEEVIQLANEIIN